MTAVETAAVINISTMVWTALLSAPGLSRAPMRLEMAAPPPIPMPLARERTKKKSGKAKPTAERESGPLPETQMASARL